MMDATIVRRNLRLLVGIRCLAPTLVLLPVFVVFFQARGLSHTEIFITQAVFSALMVMTEVPSGWFADQFGYKKSLVIGALIAMLGHAAYLPDIGLASILIAEALCGLGFGFISGADSSLAYESLAAIGKEDTFGESYGQKLQIWNNLAGILFGMGGGMLALVDIHLVLLVQAVVTGAAILLALALHEVPRSERFRQSARSIKGAMRGMKHVLVYALHGHPTIKWLILFSAFISASLQIMFWLQQPYLLAAQVPVWLFGILHSGFLLAGVAFAFLTKKYKALGRKRVLTWFVVTVAGSCVILAIGPAWWLLPMFLGFYFVSSVFYSIVEGYVHDEITDKTIRASVVSVRKLAGQLVFIPTGITVGLAVDSFSLQPALLSVGIIWAVVGTAIVVRMAQLRLFTPQINSPQNE